MTVELSDGEREFGEIEVDVLSVPDELEEVVALENLAGRRFWHNAYLGRPNSLQNESTK